MKKSLIALAALAAAGVASAQSSVTLFGVVDVGYENVKTEAGRVSGMAPSANSSSRLGFRGVEDLGGGMSASFWLEAALAPNTGIGSSGVSGNNQTVPAAGATALAGGSTAGGLTFNRRSTVSLSGGFGEVRLGRDYSPTFWNYTIFDPFGTNSVGTTLPAYTGNAMAGTFVRSSNSIGYFLPANLGGIYGQLMYAFGNRQSTETSTRPAAYGATTVDTSSNGRYIGGRIGYQQGPVNVAASYGRTKYAAGTFAFSPLGISLGATAAPAVVGGGSIVGGDYTDLNIGGSYTFGTVKVMAYYSRQKLADAGVFGTGALAPLSFGGPGNSFTVKGYQLGVDWGIGAGNVLGSYSRVSAEGEHAQKFALGYVHNLSKRTAVYGIVSRVTNTDGSAMTAGSFSSGALGAVTAPISATNPTASGNLGGKSTGFDIGLRHAF